MKIELRKIAKLLISADAKDIDAEIVDFFSKKETVDDKTIHFLAEKLGMNPHEFEGRIYGILSGFLHQGQSKGMDFSIPNKELYDKAVAIEMEHTTIPAIAKKIVRDHVAESGWKYYAALIEMEKQLGK